MEKVQSPAPQYHKRSTKGEVGGVGGVAGAWTSVITWQERDPCHKPEIYCCQSLTQEALNFLLVLLKIGLGRTQA